MTAVTRTAVHDIRPVDRAEAAELAQTEYRRFVEMLCSLRPDDWDRPTDCIHWTVHDVAAHVVGETEAFASVREFARQWRRAPRVRREIGAEYLIDGVNEVQVRDRRHLPPEQLIAHMTAAAPVAARKRAGLPPPLRAVPVGFPVVGRRSVGYLVDLVITRDVWMDRVDITRATGGTPVLSAVHDGRLVADMVSDWASTHTDPFLLELTGPAGGTFVRGQAASTRVDAVQFLRVVSGRGTGDGVLAHPLPL